MKELRERINQGPIVDRPRLGTKNRIRIQETNNVHLSTGKKSMIDISSYLEKLEDIIFGDRATEKVFNYIYNYSIGDEITEYIIGQKEFEKLPGIIARYFIFLSKGRNKNKYQLRYLTKDRVKQHLETTLSHLVNSKNSRHGYIPIWYPDDNYNLDRMVPSLLGFHIEQDIFDNITFTVLIRSCDIEFLLYDIWYFLNIARHCLWKLNGHKIEVKINIFNLHKYLS
jgi:thymidylate synthase